MHVQLYKYMYVGTLYLVLYHTIHPKVIMLSSKLYDLTFLFPLTPNPLTFLPRENLSFNLNRFHSQA